MALKSVEHVQWVDDGAVRVAPAGAATPADARPLVASGPFVVLFYFFYLRGFLVVRSMAMRNRGRCLWRRLRARKGEATNQRPRNTRQTYQKTMIRRDIIVVLKHKYNSE